MHVGDKNPPQLTDPQFAAQKLVLSTLATIEEPDLGSLGQTQRYRRDIARSRGHAGTCTEKSDLQGVEEWRFVPYPVTGQ